MTGGVSERPPGYRYARRDMLPLVRALSVIPDGRNAVLLALQWAVILASGAIAIHVDRFAVYLLAGFVIGSRFQCLAVLMHEACHAMLFSNRRINDLAGDFLLAFPLGFSIHLYRANHMYHHRYTNSARDRDWRVQKRDPDQRFPKSGRAMTWLFVRSLLGLNFYRMVRDSWIWIPLANFHNPGRFGFDYRLGLRIRYLVWAVLVYGAILWSPWRWQILGLFMLPQFIWLNIFNRIRAMAEHNGLPDERELNGTRTVIPNLADRFFIGPFHVSYHLEHHLFPSVPWHNLVRLHRHLMTDPAYAEKAHITRGYWGVIRELMPPRTSQRPTLAEAGA